MEKISISFFIWQIPIKYLLRAWYCCKVVLDIEIWSLSQGGKIAYIQITSVENSIWKCSKVTQRRRAWSPVTAAPSFEMFFLSVLSFPSLLPPLGFGLITLCMLGKGGGWLTLSSAREMAKESWVQEKPLAWWSLLVWNLCVRHTVGLLW